MALSSSGSERTSSTNIPFEINGAATGARARARARETGHAETRLAPILDCLSVHRLVVQPWPPNFIALQQLYACLSLSGWEFESQHCDVMKGKTYITACFRRDKPTEELSSAAAAQVQAAMVAVEVNNPAVAAVSSSAPQPKSAPRDATLTELASVLYSNPLLITKDRKFALLDEEGSRFGDWGDVAIESDRAERERWRVYLTKQMRTLVSLATSTVIASSHNNPNRNLKRKHSAFQQQQQEEKEEEEEEQELVQELVQEQEQEQEQEQLQSKWAGGAEEKEKEKEEEKEEETSVDVQIALTLLPIVEEELKAMGFL
jgi:hypothetical protein